MIGIAQRLAGMAFTIATAGSLGGLAVPAPPASAQTPPLNVWDWEPPDPPDCADWKSGGFSRFFPNADADAVGSCLRDGADVNARDHDNRTPLHSALVNAGDLGVINALLAGGADVNARDWAGTTPLHLAARYTGKLAFVTALVESGAGVNARDAAGGTPLHSALHNRNHAVAGVLLAAGADPLLRDDRGRIADPSHCEHWNSRAFAAAVTNEAMARCIESGADVHARLRGFGRASFGLPYSDEGNTPLHHAAMYENGGNVALLLEAGAEVDARQGGGATPLISAVAHGRRAPAAVLLEWGADVDAHDDANLTALHHAVRRGDPEDVALLLEAGANVAARDTGGATALHRAAVAGRSAVVRYLLGAGAAANARDNAGQTPLHNVSPPPASWYNRRYAVGRKPAPPAPPTWWDPARHLPNPAIVPLLEAGADPSARDTSGNTPLHRAASANSPANVGLLLAAGASVHARNRSGETPLHMRAMSGEEGSAGPTTAYLVRAGADMSARNDEGRTPMQLALRSRTRWVVDELLELGADPERPDTAERNAGPGTCELPDRAFLDSATGETLKECIASGADVNARDRSGRTALHYLVRSERPNPAARALIVTLVEAGADVNARDRRGNAPLHAAAEAGRSEMASALLEAGADVNAATGSGRTPLHGAVVAKRDGVELVSLLVGAGANVDAGDELGRTPLHVAFDAVRRDVFDALIRLGADPTLPDDSGSVPDPTSCTRWNTRMFFAIAGADVVAGCIREGADVTAASEELPRSYAGGTTPLHLAAELTRDPAVIFAMVRAGADVGARDDRGYAPLHRAARHNTDPAIVSALLEAGAEVDSWATGFHIDYGWDYTPLHEATANANPAVAAVLAGAGARVNARAREHVNARRHTGWTPLHMAAMRACRPALISILTGAGADPNLRTDGGWTSLYAAAAANSGPGVMAALLEAGADVNVRAWGGRTALHVATRRADPDVVAVLLELGAQVNAPMANGWTPLHVAASRGPAPAMVELLVQAGADLHARGRGGRTPLHQAALSPAKYRLLLQLGADPAAPDDDGRTPLDYVRGNRPRDWRDLIFADPAVTNPCRTAGN